jgi:integrase
MIFRITSGEKGSSQERIKRDNLIQLEELDIAYCRAFGEQWDPKRKIHNRNVINRFIMRFPYVRDITHESLGQYIKERNGITIRNLLRSSSTINRELSELRRLLNWALQAEMIEKNPFLGFRLLKEGNHRERILTDDELKRLLATIKKREFSDFRPIVLIALYTGMRRGEIMGFKWSDVDESKREFDLLKTKNGKRRRIPISYIVWKELKKLSRKSEYAFPSPTKPDQPRKKIWNWWSKGIDG